ncbi:MAG: DegT/DnrJ/EryC1/StrS family aminotransferase [Verrucomicrobiota bacterium]
MIEYESLGKSNAHFLSEYLNAAADVIHSGWYILGQHLQTFERSFAAYNNSPYCIGVASGLDALSLSIAALELEHESEILVPSNTYIATILSVLHQGMRPVLVEPNLRSYNIDADKIEAAITPKTRALMVVHLYGKPCEMDKIQALCIKHHLHLIEDCAQSHGATFRGQKTGTFGDFGAFSFYPTKNLGALGDGGAVLCKDSKLSDRISTLRNYGSKEKYHNKVIGYNSRLDEIQSAFLSVKLKHLNEINTHKQLLAQLYFDSLKNEFILPERHPDYFDVYHIFNIRHPARDRIRAHLLQNGIKTEIHYPVAPAEQQALAGMFRKEDYPISTEIHQTTLSLPISFGHTSEQIEYVIKTLNAF